MQDHDTREFRMYGGAFPPPPPGPPGSGSGPAGGRSTASAARAWGAVSLAFGALVLVGSMIPWFSEGSFAFTDDMGSSWPLIVIGLIGVLGGVDGLRGSVAGPSMAAGIGSLFVLIHVGLVRAVTQAPAAGLGGGGVAWSLAALAAVVLLVAMLAVLPADGAQGTAPGWLSAGILVAGAVWGVGILMPTFPGAHVGDLLFGGDTFSDVLTVAFVAVPGGLVLLAAASRSRAAHGLAAGGMTFWALVAVTSGDGVLRAGVGRFWPTLLGALGVAICGCLAMLRPGDAVPLGPAGPVVPLLPAVGIALLPIAGIAGAAHYDDHHDTFGLTATTAGSFGSTDVSDSAGVDDSTSDSTGGVGSGRSGSVDVVCTDTVGSTIRSAWQDVEGAIHVIVLLDNGCGSGQQLADPSASFTLTSGGATVADATFDFSTHPVVVPGNGTSQTEIVFGPGTFVDLAAVETLGLRADASSGTGSLGLRYSYTCTGADGSTSTSTTGTAVPGEPTDTPVVPRTTTEDDALARLAAIAQADKPFIQSDVIDRWVPQISSKKPNVTLPNGSIWNAVSILQDHRSWRERFPRVRLLWSGDYSTFKSTDFWVTIVAIPFDTPDGALAWCTANALPSEDCYAKLISHTQPPTTSTKIR